MRVATLRIVCSADRLASGTQFTRLFAAPVIYHHGQQATGGHYTCDVLHPCGDWLRIDDSKVEDVTPNEVLASKPDRVAYVLFYERP